MNAQIQDDDPRALLPWYLNGTLSEEESRRVEEWLESEGEQAEAELAMLHELREHLQEQEHQGPGELGWHRLKRQIQKDRASPGWYRPALAATLVVVVLQAGLLGRQWFSADGANDWQTLSATTAQGQIQVRFNPGSSEQQIRELLRRLRLELVAGPSAQGVYRLRGLAGSDQDPAELVNRLQQAGDLVTHAAVDK